MTREQIEIEMTSLTDNFWKALNVQDFNDGIFDPTYINDIVDCSDLGIYPWGDS